MKRKIVAADAWDVALGAAVRQRRRHINLTQTELGEAVGVTFQQVQKYERGSNRISFSALVRICEALKCSPHALISTVDPPEPVDWQESTRGVLIAPEDQELLNAFASIGSPQVKQAVFEMIQKMSDLKRK